MDHPLYVSVPLLVTLSVARWPPSYCSCFSFSLALTFPDITLLYSHFNFDSGFELVKARNPIFSSSSQTFFLSYSSGIRRAFQRRQSV